MMARHCKLLCGYAVLGESARVKGIRRLFLPPVGMQNSVEHLYEEFRHSLWERPENHVPLEKGVPNHSGLPEPAHGGKRWESLEGKPESQRVILCELLSETSCAEWLGFNDLARPDTKPPLRTLAGLIREPGWTNAKNVQKLRMYRAATFIDCLRPNALDWETPCIPDMEWVLEFIDVFTRPGISIAEQTDLIDDLARPRVPLETIVRTARGPRLVLSLSELSSVYETKDLSHEERAIAWDSRSPRPFQPFGRSNLEMHRDKQLTHRWRTAVNHQLKKARALYDSDP